MKNCSISFDFVPSKFIYNYLFLIEVIEHFKYRPKVLHLILINKGQFSFIIHFYIIFSPSNSDHYYHYLLRPSIFFFCSRRICSSSQKSSAVCSDSSTCDASSCCRALLARLLHINALS